MDDDGYAVGDPYAQAAKMIDRKHGKGNPSTTKAKMVKVAKTILENKDTVKFYEQIFKILAVVVIIIYMVASSEEASK